MNDNRKISLSMVIHNHQPVDNQPKVIELLYQRSYLPFVMALANHRTLKANLHYTGPLLDWLENNHPEFLDAVRDLAKTGQVAIVGGGYYEPIISAIPDSDAAGQTDLMRKRIKSLFGVTVRGFWLAERAWEPRLPEVLSSAGVCYTAIDDTVLTGVGVKQKNCFYPFIVESRGSQIIAFPILKKLRYLIPFEKPESTISFLQKNRGSLNEIAVFGDDGEKFGAWPNTYDLVYKKKWLESFFSLLERHAETISTTTLDDYIDHYEFSDNPMSVHLPAASYDELMKWSLPAGPIQEQWAFGDSSSPNTMKVGECTPR